VIGITRTINMEVLNESKILRPLESFFRPVGVSLVASELRQTCGEA
jgi:hypothetical protein